MSLIRRLLQKSTARVLELEDRSAVLCFRAVILFLLLFFTLYDRGADASAPPLWPVLAVVLVHLASNVALAWVPRHRLKRGLLTGVFFFDIAVLSLVIYLTHGFESDLYLIYFLVIFMTVVSRQPSASFIVAGLGCLLYGFLFLKQHSLDELLQSSVLIRFPLFLIAAFFSHLIVRDIQEESRELRESEERFRQFAEHIREVFWMTTADKRRMIYISPGYEDIWGRSCEALYESPLTWMDAIHPEDRERISGAALRKQEAGTYDEEYRIVRPDGGLRWIRDRAFPIRDASGGVYRIAGIAEDITASKAAEQELRKVAEMKSRFASNVSHELRTPLAVMKSGIVLLADGTAGPLTDRQAQCVDIVLRNTERLHRLVDEILDYAKLQAGKADFRFLEGDLNRTVREAAESYRNMAEAQGLEFRVETDGAVPPLRYDADKIVQVLSNLLSNALKFTASGRVAVSTSFLAGQRSAVVRVRDTGPGIRKDDLPKLFQEFQQVGEAAGNKAGGTGLGLAISREIVEGHGGRIWAESEYGKGAEFSFSLPAGTDGR